MAGTKKSLDLHKHTVLPSSQYPPFLLVWNRISMRENCDLYPIFLLNIFRCSESVRKWNVNDWLKNRKNIGLCLVFLTKLDFHFFESFNSICASVLFLEILDIPGFFLFIVGYRRRARPPSFWGCPQPLWKTNQIIDFFCLQN